MPPGVCINLSRASEAHLILRIYIVTFMSGLAIPAYAFEAIYSKLNKVALIPFSAYRKQFPLDIALNDSPLFVTWNVLEDGHEPELRGCIGTFEPLELVSGIKQYAEIAAFDDTRFSPIVKSELPTLGCHVTLLTDFEGASDKYDWEVGTHGIRIGFQYKGRRRSATFLPEVASSQGWDKKTTLKYLVAKAGGPQGNTDVDSLDILLTRYQGKVFELSYGQFIKIRKEIA